eukprot:UC1_evm1s508
MAYESIGQLAEKARIAAQGDTQGKSRGSRYASVHASRVKHEATATKKATATMGPLTYKDPLATSKILKKQTGGAGSRIKNSPGRSGPFKSAKPGVPRATERPVMGMKSKKNYLKNNALAATNASPRKTAAARLDGTRGRAGRFELEESGLVPKYTQREDFGRVPDYLQTFKQDRARQEQEYEEYVREMERQAAMYEVPPDERKKVLAGLKRNWSQLKKEYQGLSVVTDTAAKKSRKTRMEAQLAQLEADIAKIEMHQTIFIRND